MRSKFLILIKKYGMKEVNELEESIRCESHRLRRLDSLISAVSIGVFLVLIGTIFVLTSNLYSAVSRFFNDFRLVEIAPNFFLPAPVLNHPVLYLAVEVFCYLWGLFQIVVLVLRFGIGSPIYLKAKTLSRIVFWLGTGWLVSMLQTRIFGAGSRGWFAFWSAVAMLLGLSLIVQAVVLATALQRKPQ